MTPVAFSCRAPSIADTKLSTKTAIPAWVNNFCADYSVYYLRFLSTYVYLALFFPSILVSLFTVSLSLQTVVINSCLTPPLNTGKWKTLKCENRSTETEVRKRKYGNGNTEVRRKAACRWPNVPCRQRVTVSKRCESQVLIHRTPAGTQSLA